MSAENLAIGIDIGGTKIAGGIVDGNGQILRRSFRPTPGQNAALTEDAIAAVVNELSDGNQQLPVGIGAAGWINRSGSHVLFSPHLAWRDEPVLERLEAKMNRKVNLNNDADAAGWAEHRFGSARGEELSVCLTLGTGIGGAIIFDNRILRGSFGVAGEFGHQTLVVEGHRCPCGNRGCWEQYASGNALGREAAELVRLNSPRAHNLREACSADPALVTGAMVTSLAANGDLACMELIEEMGGWLGMGISNLAAVLDPGVVVIGGGLGSASTSLIATAEATYRKLLPGRGYRPYARIVRAQLGADAGLIGAADLARYDR